jgi:hypothetical protein
MEGYGRLWTVLLVNLTYLSCGLLRLVILPGVTLIPLFRCSAGSTHNTSSVVTACHVTCHGLSMQETPINIDLSRCHGSSPPRGGVCRTCEHAFASFASFCLEFAAVRGPCFPGQAGSREASANRPGVFGSLKLAQASLSEAKRG